jgi:hypothetical protein
MPELSSAGMYRVGETVVKGDADIALHQIPELMAVPSIEMVGPLPSDLHSITVFSAAVLATSKEAEAAKTLVEFLRSPGTAAGSGPGTSRCDVTAAPPPPCIFTSHLMQGFCDGALSLTASDR